MAKYTKKPRTVEAITFDELVAHGRAQPGAHIHNGMPWSFTYAGRPVSHENDDCYLIGTQGGDTMRMQRGYVLVADEKGVIYPCMADVFLDAYEPAPPSTPVKPATAEEDQ